MVEGKGLSSNCQGGYTAEDSRSPLDILREWAIIIQTRPAIVY